ncbi:aspartate aminotransferase [Colletotrichum truncatum]|uniref:Aspartate aminotransferase n=1 Tax=Colletotrichum truncatum TaxID=5467 RepID=A0ACC3ZGJ0_COLTU|nr:aspartate aminotransferase [Colletotrichum truncatum]KAF6784681.1 aspartate aminotransferase [Colletotrichum truncatum]
MRLYDSNLSDRGANYALPINKNHLLDMLRDAWHPVQNPSGFLSLGVAENTLMHKELINYIISTFTIDSHGLGYGDSFFGSHRLREVLANFLTSFFKPHAPIRPNHLIVTSGVSAAIEACAFSLCDQGDGVLLARPFYKAFPYNLLNRAGVRHVPVSFNGDDHITIDGIAAYERALLESREKGVPVKALLLCNPHNLLAGVWLEVPHDSVFQLSQHNPSGRCASRELLQEYMRFCQKYNLHLISDEIYGLSVWENPEIPHAPTFHSVLSIDPTGLINPALVHVLWGMSKDFGANGLRLGCVVSQHNKDFLQALETNSIFTCPSSLSDRVTASILSNTDFVNSYLNSNQALLAAKYKKTIDFLGHHGISQKPSNAGFFVWADLFTFWSPRLGSRTKADEALGEAAEHQWALEERLNATLLSNKVFLAAGSTFRTEEAGWFRITFAHDQGYLDEGLKRILKSLEEFKNTETPGE